MADRPYYHRSRPIHPSPRPPPPLHPPSSASASAPALALPRLSPLALLPIRAAAAQSPPAVPAVAPPVASHSPAPSEARSSNARPSTRRIWISACADASGIPRLSPSSLLPIRAAAAQSPPAVPAVAPPVASRSPHHRKPAPPTRGHQRAASGSPPARTHLASTRFVIDVRRCRPRPCSPDAGAPPACLKFAPMLASPVGRGRLRPPRRTSTLPPLAAQVSISGTGRRPPGAVARQKIKGGQLRLEGCRHVAAATTMDAWSEGSPR
ncbi:hypothetical protein PVAP13_2KG390300 [Panicum virgatum]|uniref:Uncharacterized protein n=1 Tax=Panicum virgatum TaxID=38727 RepID=A0A8T0WGL7_PANVG|nr:hypothetical protein PVAP13_2KG390300 [Panicum virgatum]